MSKIGDEAESSGSSIRSVGRKGAAAIGALTTAVTGAVAGIAKLTKNATEYASQVQNASEQSGLAAENIQEIAFAAERTSSASFDTVRDGLKELAIRSEEAANGTGEAKEAFDELGISQQELQSMNTAETFRRVRQELQGASASMRTFAAEQLFGGEAGEKLVETLGLSNQEMQKLRRQARETGKVLSTEQVQALDQTRKAWSRIKSTFTGVGRTIATAMLPVVKRITPLIQQVARQIQALFRGLDASAVRGAMNTAIQWTRRLWSVTQTVADGVVGVWNQFVSGLSTLWDEWGTFITERLRITFGHLKSLFVGVAGVVSGVWKTLVGTLTGNWSRAWDGITQVVTTAALTVAESITAMVQSVLSTLSALTGRIPGVGDTISAGLDSAEQSVANFRDRIQEANRAAAGLQSVWSGFSGGDFGGGGAGGLFGGTTSSDAKQPGGVSIDTSGGPGASGGDGQGQGLPSLQPIFRLVNQMPKKLSLMKQAGRKATNVVAQGLNRISSGLGKAITGVISGENAFKSFGQAAVRALKNVLSQLLALIPKLAIISGLKSIFDISSGGITSIGGVLTEVIPGLDVGGKILSDGIAKVHKGETVVPDGGGMAGQSVNVTLSGGLSVSMDELVFALDRNLRAKGKAGLL
jgi:hypothetical protein